MRRKAAVAVVGILAALSFVGVAFASHLVGEVISANPSTKTLMINANGLEMTFSVADNIAKDLAKLKPGAKVAIHYTQAEGKQPQAHVVFPWPIGG